MKARRTDPQTRTHTPGEVWLANGRRGIMTCSGLVIGRHYVPRQVVRDQGVSADDDLPTIAMMEAGALTLTQCGLHGSRDSLMATADSVWRAMEEAREPDDYESEERQEEA